MGKALFSASKTLGDPSALRPQGDKKRGLRATKKGASGRQKKGPQGDMVGGSSLRERMRPKDLCAKRRISEGALATERPRGRPFAVPSLRSGLRLGATRS